MTATQNVQNLPKGHDPKPKHETSDAIAIDIVLVPPLEILTKAIQSNRLLNPDVNKIVLEESVCVPHITLAMGVIEKTHLREIMDGLQKIALSHSRLELMTTNTCRTVLESGEVISGVNVSKTDALDQLHMEAMKLLEPFQHNEFGNEVLEEGENADPQTLEFIRLFPVTASRNNYNPHITLGFGELFETSLHNSKFECETIALYHLGSYCTCKELLDSHRLRTGK